VSHLTLLTTGLASRPGATGTSTVRESGSQAHTALDEMPDTTGQRRASTMFFACCTSLCRDLISWELVKAVDGVCASKGVA